MAGAPELSPPPALPKLPLVVSQEYNLFSPAKKAPEGAGACQGFHCTPPDDKGGKYARQKSGLEVYIVLNFTTCLPVILVWPCFILNCQPQHPSPPPAQASLSKTDAQGGLTAGRGGPLQASPDLCRELLRKPKSFGKVMAKRFGIPGASALWPGSHLEQSPRLPGGRGSDNTDAALGCSICGQEKRTS